MTRPNPARVLNDRDAQIAREALARAAVVDAALAIDDSQWAWLWDATPSRAINGPFRELVESVAELRALVPKVTP